MTTPPSDGSLDLTDVFSYVDRHRQEFLEWLIDYVRRPSISAYGEGIGEVAEYIAMYWKRAVFGSAFSRLFRGQPGVPLSWGN